MGSFQRTETGLRALAEGTAIVFEAGPDGREHQRKTCDTPEAACALWTQNSGSWKVHKLGTKAQVLIFTTLGQRLLQVIFLFKKYF